MHRVLACHSKQLTKNAISFVLARLDVQAMWS